MWNKLWYKINNTVIGGAFLISFFSFLSKLFGLIRERLIAGNFGASELSDIYYSAFRLPDLIFNTFVLGAFTSAFIPVFQKVWLKSKADGNVLANSVINAFMLFIGFLVIVAIIFAPQIMPYITPGFQAWQLEQVVDLTRVMLVAVLFFVVSTVMGGILNSWKRFFSFSLAASLYNIGIIIGIIYFYPRLGLIGLAWGVLLGAGMHLVAQLPEIIKYGWRYKFVLKFDKHLKKILKLMIPRTIGLAAGQVNLVVITMVASTLTAGSIAVFNLANNLQSLPISLFAVSLAVAAFPTFTQAISENKQSLFAESFSITIRRILYVLIPISIMIVILRAQIVRVILGTGALTWDNTLHIAQALGFFALSIFAQGLIPILARAFYAFEDTKTPTAVGIVSIFINIILSFSLANIFGVIGLALAFSIASIINMFILYIILQNKISIIDNTKILNSLLKISLLSFVAGSVTYGSLQIIAPLVDMQKFWGIFTQGVGSAVLGLLSYLILSIVFRLDEIDIVRKFLKKFILLFRNGKNT